jgi:hypothetical protein
MKTLCTSNENIVIGSKMRLSSLINNQGGCGAMVSIAIQISYREDGSNRVAEIFNFNKKSLGSVIPPRRITKKCTEKYDLSTDRDNGIAIRSATLNFRKKNIKKLEKSV